MLKTKNMNLQSDTRPQYSLSPVHVQILQLQLYKKLPVSYLHECLAFELTGNSIIRPFPTRGRSG